MRSLLLMLPIAIAIVAALQDASLENGGMQDVCLQDTDFQGFDSPAGQDTLTAPTSSRIAETNNAAALSTNSSVPNLDEWLFLRPFEETNSPDLSTFASNESASTGEDWEPHSPNSFGTTPCPTTLLTNTTAPNVPLVNRESDTRFAVTIGNRSVDRQNLNIAINGSIEPNPWVWDDWMIDVWDDESTNCTSLNDNSTGPEDPPRSLVGVKDLWQTNNPEPASQEIIANINPLWLNGLQLEEKPQYYENGEESGLPWWTFSTSAAIAAAFGVMTEDDEEERKRRRPSKPVNIAEAQYVNAKQFHRILKRRVARERLERVLKLKRLYSYGRKRNYHAMRRPRAPGGRFLTADEVAEIEKSRVDCKQDRGRSPEESTNSSGELSPNPDSCTAPKCMSCNSVDDLWICLTCAHMGCGTHGKQHWANSGHNLAQMAVGRACAWDYQKGSWIRPGDVPSLDPSGLEPSPTNHESSETSDPTSPKKRAYTCDIESEAGALPHAAKRVKTAQNSTAKWTSVTNVASEDRTQADVALECSSQQDADSLDIVMTDDDLENTQDHVGTSQSSVATPLRLHQPPDGSSTCPQCHRSLRRLCDLKKHMMTHTKPVRCMVFACTYACTTNKDLRRHYESKHTSSDSKEVFFCSYNDCGKRFSRHDNMLRHMQNVHGPKS